MVLIIYSQIFTPEKEMTVGCEETFTACRVSQIFSSIILVVSSSQTDTETHTNIFTTSCSLILHF